MLMTMYIKFSLRAGVNLTSKNILLKRLVCLSKCKVCFTFSKIVLT